jgi:hypothetical protein
LDFYLPAHVLERRLPYHEELVAAISDLTKVLKKTVLTEAVVSPNADTVAQLGLSFLEAAQQAHTIFGTPLPEPLAPPQDYRHSRSLLNIKG